MISQEVTSNGHEEATTEQATQKTYAKENKTHGRLLLKTIRVTKTGTIAIIVPTWHANFIIKIGAVSSKMFVSRNKNIQLYLGLIMLYYV